MRCHTLTVGDISFLLLDIRRRLEPIVIRLSIKPILCRVTLFGFEALAHVDLMLVAEEEVVGFYSLLLHPIVLILLRMSIG